MCIKADDVVNGPAALPIGWLKVDDSVKIGAAPIPNAAKGFLNTVAVVSTMAAAPGVVNSSATPVAPTATPTAVTPPATPVAPTAAVTAAAKSLRKVLESLDD
jgi:hypothetical protein